MYTLIHSVQLMSVECAFLNPIRLYLYVFAGVCGCMERYTHHKTTFTHTYAHTHTTHIWFLFFRHAFVYNPSKLFYVLRVKKTDKNKIVHRELGPEFNVCFTVHLVNVMDSICRRKEMHFYIAAFAFRGERMQCTHQMLPVVSTHSNSSKPTHI